jgi:hypothetical protein
MSIIIKGTSHDTVKQACERLEISRPTLLTYIKDGTFLSPPTQKKGRKIFVRYFTLILCGTILTPCLKKRPQQPRRFILANPAVHLWPVMHRRLAKQLWSMLDCTAFGVACAVIQPGNSCVGDGSGAHGAGF